MGMLRLRQSQGLTISCCITDNLKKSKGNLLAISILYIGVSTSLMNIYRNPFLSAIC